MRNYTSLLVLAATLLGGVLRGQVPQLVSYQGHVAVDAVNFEGAGQFKFALVNNAGTITFWSNDGTSAGGSEPTAAVTLVVAKGLYSVLLGDTALGNMTTISATVFANPDVRLRVWFNDGAHGSQLLTPDQRLAPAAYLADGTVTSASVGAAAITSGKIAPGAVDGTNIAPASLTSGSFAVPGPPVNGQVLGYNNGGLTWTAPGGGVFSLNGTSAYYNGGNVGIGTTAPAAKFEVNGLLRSTRVGLAIQYIQLNGGDPNSINLTAQSAVAAEKNLVIENLSGESTPGANNNIQFVLGTAAARSTKMTLTTDGNVGIGTAAPVAKLQSETSGANTVAVYGKATSNGIGVYGYSDTGYAVYGSNINNGFAGYFTGSAYGIYATSNQYAGYFNGYVFINGNFAVNGTKSFKIDHPLDPANKYLLHSCIESSEVLNLYTGNVTTDATGDATVTMPEWFEALNRDFRYQLTVIGQFAQAIVSSEIKDHSFGIKSDKPNVKVSWQVTGVRNDAYMQAHPFVVEEDKSEKERGAYLRPELFGQPEEKSIGRLKGPELAEPKTNTSSQSKP